MRSSALREQRPSAPVDPVAIQVSGRSSGSTSPSRCRSGPSSSSSSGRRRMRKSAVYRLGWIGDDVDAMNFLELWTCDSGNNNANFCDPSYDRLVTEARRTLGQPAALRAVCAARAEAGRRRRRAADDPDLLVRTPR